jgi:protein ImuB
MPFACIFVPDFPVEAILRAEPELRSQAVAVLEGKPPLQKICVVNNKARRAGIAPGMTKIQVEPCTELVLRPRSPFEEAAAHAAMLDCAQSFSPRIEDTAPDTVILDLSGLEALFGSLPKIARAIARRTSELGLEANVATAFKPDTALLAARGFSGVTVVPEGEEGERLGNLPLDVLFPEFSALHPTEDSARFLETFDLWGVRNLRALCALPEVALSERLDQPGVRLQQLARGAISRTLVPVEPPLVFEEVLELEHPLVLLEPLAFLLARMLEQLCARLAARALAAQELHLRMELDSGFQLIDDPDGPPQRSGSRAKDLSERPRGQPASGGIAMSATRASLFTRTLQLPIPMLDAKVFLKLLQLDLQAHPPGAPILKVHVSATPAQPRTVQGGLFRPPAPEPEKLEFTLARIASMVGEDKVGSLQLLDSHRPEAFCMQRFVPTEPEGPKGKSDSISSPAPIIALRMFRPPLRATVRLRDSKPDHVACPKRKEISGEILWMAGPWRSSGDWWEQDGWARDEWDIAIQLPVAGRPQAASGVRFEVEPWSGTSSLALYRLVHDLLSGRWFVEGTYD